MPGDALVTDGQVVQAIAAVPGDDFTILDFMAAFQALYPQVWQEVSGRFGERGDGTHRSYTVATYLGNRLWQVSKQPGSPLAPLVPWRRGEETPNQRRPTPAEKRLGLSGWVRVFRKAR